MENDFMDKFFKYAFPFIFIGALIFVPVAAYMGAVAKQKVMAAKGIQMTLWEAAFTPNSAVQDIGVKVR